MLLMARMVRTRRVVEQPAILELQRRMRLDYREMAVLNLE
jgi:hypothetical protein